MKVLNRRGFCDQAASVWTDMLLYKPPLKQRTADFQWRILHGAIASNAFILILLILLCQSSAHSAASVTVFHIYSECERLLRFNIFD